MLALGPPVDVPVLAETVGEAHDEVIGQLRAAGWGAFGDPVAAEVSISPSGLLSLTATGQILLHEIANPAAHVDVTDGFTTTARSLCSDSS